MYTNCSTYNEVNFFLSNTIEFFGRIVTWEKQVTIIVSIVIIIIII